MEEIIKFKVTRDNVGENSKSKIYEKTPTQWKFLTKIIPDQKMSWKNFVPKHRAAEVIRCLLWNFWCSNPKKYFISANFAIKSDSIFSS